ncbi:MAG TPA: glycosyltransferase family 4 protein, partial [Verrucomicrobiae bacterium]|nr:glycosyltransferase family 4 protein [Verrucomicrobiae bacterium]
SRLATRAAFKTDDFACVDQVYRDLDLHVARSLERTADAPQAVHGYEDGAFATFRCAARREIRRTYELPIAYWATGRSILAEEAERLPHWEPTLGSTRDEQEKLDRKDEELRLADCIICPGNFVLESLPREIRDQKQCVIAPFGSPVVPTRLPIRRGALRVLFAGTLSQRKGLADVFAAFRLLGRNDVELVVVGTPMMPLPFYKKQFSHFTFEPPRPHSALLELMQSCDLLVLPSLVEGRALVQQEALACGLPLIVTANAGGEDLIEEGKSGFLVPIRSPAKIAEKLEWFATHRDALEEMRAFCRAKAAEYSWSDYAEKILSALLVPSPSPVFA